MDSYDELAENAKKFLDGEISETEFIATPGGILKPMDFSSMIGGGPIEVEGDMEVTFVNPELTNEDNTISVEKLQSAIAKLNKLGPVATKITVPIVTYLRILCEADRHTPEPGWALSPLPGDMFGGIAIQGDWNLSDWTVTDFSDGSREVRWCPQ